MLRAVLFDHDGTLVDSESVHFDLWNGVLARYGARLSEQEYRDFYAGIPTRDNARDVVTRFGLAEMPEVLAAQKVAATRDYLACGPFPLMPGVREALAACADMGLQFGIVTGASAEGVASTVRGHQLESVFRVRVSADDVRASKPAPDCYLLALQRLGLAAQQCIAVEDTEHGLSAAADAGIACLAVPTRMTRHHDFRRAAAVLDGLPEVVRYIRDRVTPDESCIAQEKP